jgi:hypothetical protein
MVSRATEPIEGRASRPKPEGADIIEPLIDL